MILVVAVIANHLISPQNFPTHPDYTFPWANIAFTLVLTLASFFLSEVTFRWFRERYFSEKVTTQHATAFFLTTLGLFSVVYLLFYLVVVQLYHGVADLHGYLAGWLVSLMIISIVLGLFYWKPLFELHRASLASGQLKVQSGKRTEFLTYEDIAYLLSHNKVVYLVKTDGTYLITEFSLAELEKRLPDQQFFRANRQALLNRQGVVGLESTTNGKLLINLTVPFQEQAELTVSRYKAKELKQWLAQA